MTNGEKIKEIFPDTKIITQYDNPFGDRFMVFKLNNEDMQVNIDWWNAEYKEPTTKNDLEVDCISREQALVAIRNLYPSMPRVDFNGSLRKWVDKYKPYIECDDAIKQLPSVTPQEPKTGHWNEIPKYKDIAWQCSECERFTTMKHNYCPKCGAKMVEPQESEVEE